MKFCARCGCKADYDWSKGHPYYCPRCNKDLYALKVEERCDVVAMLYGFHLHEGGSDDWHTFVRNELYNEERMEYLLTLHGMHHEIAFYKLIVECHRSAIEHPNALHDYVKHDIESMMGLIKQ